MKVWIGTSGYSYADWVGPFYPHGLRPKQMLRYYGGHFPVVELNFTFYRLPTAAMLARLADQTPQASSSSPSCRRPSATRKTRATWNRSARRWPSCTAARA
jgi:hypothetical protein